MTYEMTEDCKMTLKAKSLFLFGFPVAFIICPSVIKTLWIATLILQIFEFKQMINLIKVRNLQKIINGDVVNQNRRTEFLKEIKEDKQKEK